MPFFSQLRYQLLGKNADAVRPIQDVLPKKALTDVEVRYYLTDGSESEQIRTTNWLYDAKFIGFLYAKIKECPDLKEELFFSYNDAVTSICINIKTRVYKGESSLNTYFHKIFNNKVLDIFERKKTNKAQA